MPDLTLALRDGALLALVASAIVMGSLRANPRLFMRHFPAAVRERQAPLTPGEMRAGRIVGLLLLGALAGGPLISAALMVADKGPQPAWALFLHAFIVGMVFNTVDWLVLDELWLGVLRPRWALPPGAVEADFIPFDHGRHARGFVAGTELCAAMAVVASGLLSLWAALG